RVDAQVVDRLHCLEVLLEARDVGGLQRDPRRRLRADAEAQQHVLAVVLALDAARPAVAPGLLQRRRRDAAEIEEVIGRARVGRHVVQLLRELGQVLGRGAQVLVELRYGLRARRGRVFAARLQRSLLAQHLDRAEAARRLAGLALALVRRALARLFLLPAPHLLFLLEPLLLGGAQPRLLLEVVAPSELVQVVQERVGRRLLRVDEQRLVVRRVRVLHFAQFLRHVTGVLVALLGPFRERAVDDALEPDGELRLERAQRGMR